MLYPKQSRCHCQCRTKTLLHRQHTGSTPAVQTPKDLNPHHVVVFSTMIPDDQVASFGILSAVAVVKPVQTNTAFAYCQLAHLYQECTYCRPINQTHGSTNCRQLSAPAPSSDTQPGQASAKVHKAAEKLLLQLSILLPSRMVATYACSQVHLVQGMALNCPYVGLHTNTKIRQQLHCQSVASAPLIPVPTT